MVDQTIEEVSGSWESVCSGRLQGGLAAIGSPDSESCLLWLYNFQKHNIFFDVTVALVFLPGIKLVALGITKCGNGSGSACTAFFS